MNLVDLYRLMRNTQLADEQLRFGFATVEILLPIP